MQTNRRNLTKALSFIPLSVIPEGRLGDRLRVLRREDRLTQEELSELSGVARPQISLIEQGSVDPRRGTRIALALALERRLGQRVSEFFTVGAVAISPDRISDAPLTPPRSLAEVLNFMSGWKEAVVEAEVACGEPLNYSVQGEKVLVPEGEAPDELKGERLLRARGDSMMEFGIKDGDYVVVEMRQGGYPATNEIVIAWYDEGITMKRWMNVGGRKMLQAGSPDYPSFEVKEGVAFELKAIVRRRIRIDHFPKISG